MENKQLKKYLLHHSPAVASHSTLTYFSLTLSAVSYSTQTVFTLPCGITSARSAQLSSVPAYMDR